MNTTLTTATLGDLTGYNKARVIEFIRTYQEKHHGQSPSVHAIARDTGLSIGQTGYYLKVAEQEGQLKVAGDGPQQYIIFPKGDEPKDENPLPKNETSVRALTKEGVSKPRSASVTPPTKRGSGTKKSWRTRAEEIAQYLHSMGDRKVGSLMIAKAVYGTNHTSNVPGVIKKMRSRGWVIHRDNYPNDVSLTDKGRKVLLGIKPPKEAKVEPVGEWTTPVNCLSDVTARLRGGRSTMPPTEEDGPDDEDYEGNPSGHKTSPPEQDHAPTFPQVISGGVITVPLSLSDVLPFVSDVDLVIELGRRGFVVSRHQN